MLGGGIRFPDACARYGAGSLANTFLPGRAGDVIRLGLFGRVVPGGTLAVAGAVAAVGAARWVVLLPLGIAGAVDDGLPVGAVALAGLAVAPLLVAWLCARGGSRRAGALLAPLRVANRATFAALAIWVGGTLVARIAAASLAGGALGVPHPVAAALLVVPALELAGIVPLTPANVGVAGGAAAFAFHANGLAAGEAVAAGFALHGVETAVTRINLDADAAHRVTLLATAGRDRRADRRHRRLDLGSLGAAAAVHDGEHELHRPTPQLPTTRRRSTDVSGALGRGGYEGIQDDSDGNIWIVEDVGGSAKPGTTAKRPNSFIYRYVPDASGRPPARQARGAPGDELCRPADHVREPGGSQQPRPGGAALVRQRPAHEVARHPRHGDGRHRALRRDRQRRRPRTRRRSSGRRTASSAPARTSRSSSSTRPATRTRRARRTTPPAAGARSTKLTQSSPSANTGTITVFCVVRREARRASTTSPSCRGTRSTFVQDMGDGLHAPGQRARLRRSSGT